MYMLPVYMREQEYKGLFPHTPVNSRRHLSLAAALYIRLGKGGGFACIRLLPNGVSAGSDAALPKRLDLRRDIGRHYLQAEEIFLR